MNYFRLVSTLLLLTALFAPLLPAQPSGPQKKRLLAIGEVKGFEHDSVSHGLATIERLGRETGLWDTYIRTDSELLTKEKLTRNAKNLNDFDAVLFYTTGELAMNDEQKAALLSFVREDGKGFLGAHSAADTFYKWPEYGEMLGGYFDGHPWNQFDAPVLTEDLQAPMMKGMSAAFTIKDEIYQIRNYSRDKVRVLQRLDPAKTDLQHKGVKRTDQDFAVTWIKPYGKGRVFYSTFGHRDEVWDRKDIQTMWIEAVKWAMGLTQADATPRPLPARN